MFLPVLIMTLGFVTVAFLFLASWLYKLSNRKHEIAIEARTQRFNKLIDKFDSSQELIDFLQSENGLKALDTITTTHSMIKIPLTITISEDATFEAQFLKEFDVTFRNEFIGVSGNPGTIKVEGTTEKLASC